MTYADGLYSPPMVELARAGNFQAIAHWIRQSLGPYGIGVRVGNVRPGCIKVLVELPSLDDADLPNQWQDQMVRFICHRIWELNSTAIEGVRIAAKVAGESKILWQQSVRVISPARRQQQQTGQLQTKVRQVSRQKSQVKLLRAFLMSGAPLFAFIVGCVLGFSKAPVDQTNASALPYSKDTNHSATGTQTNRPKTVQAALEAVPVIQHDKVTAPHDPTVTLMFSGDVTLADSFADTIGQDYDRTFAGMNEYREADLAMVNLENPLTKATLALPNKQFNFKADPNLVKVLEKGGVDVVTLANNHTMDYKEPGLTETMQTLDQAGILHVGAGQDEKEARRPEILDVKGQRVAYLAYYGADFQAAKEHTPGTNYADQARIAADIKAIRDQVDWIVVNFHWGEELATHPADWQVDLAHFTIDQGADVIVGHHPHVLQGAEIYKGRPISYSLGNFIFGGNSRKDYDTAVLKVALKGKQMKVEFLPVEVRDFQPKVVSGDRSNQILKQITDLSSGFQEPMKSPALLDARQTTSPESATPTPATPPPSPTTSPSSSPATGAPPARSFPFDPYAPAPSGSEAAPSPTVSPSPQASPTASPDTPSPFEAVPAPSPSPEGTNSNTPTAPTAPTPEPSIPADMAVPPSPSPTAEPTPDVAPPSGTKSLEPTSPENTNQYYSPGGQPVNPEATPSETTPNSVEEHPAPEVSPSPTEDRQAPRTQAENLEPEMPNGNSHPRLEERQSPAQPDNAEQEHPPGNSPHQDETADLAGSPTPNPSPTKPELPPFSAHSSPSPGGFTNSPHRTPIHSPSTPSAAKPINFEPSTATADVPAVSLMAALLW
jgi:poly-gamma-glutamate synthesis protein (capsule biosynthesis protein)